jgi:hypothetical protein
LREIAPGADDGLPQRQGETVVVTHVVLERETAAAGSVPRSERLIQRLPQTPPSCAP